MDEQNPYAYRPEPASPALSPAPATAADSAAQSAATARFHDLIGRSLQVRSKLEAGANWFYWVAGLSLVNSVLLASNTTWRFPIGLGVTTVVDVVALTQRQNDPASATMVTVIWGGINLFLAGVVAGTGWLSMRGWRWIMALGMCLYVLDALLFLLINDIFSILFHGYALWRMWEGFTAAGELESIEQELLEVAYLLPPGAEAAS